MSRVNKSNFNVSKRDNASDDNGGTLNTGNGQSYDNDGPHRFHTDVDAVSLGGNEYTLENQSDTGWGDTAPDDFIMWDVAGAKEIVLVLNVFEGSDVDVIRVSADPNGGTITTGVGKNVNVGGAWRTIDFATEHVDDQFHNSADDPITIWVMNGAYNELGTINNAGTAASPITLEGYNTVEGDGWDFDWENNLPTMDGDAGNVGSPQDAYGIAVGPDPAFWIIEHIWVKDSTANNFNFGASDQIKVIHCKSSGSAGIGIFGDNLNTVFRCEVSDNAGDGIDLDFKAEVYGNDVFGNGGEGIHVEAGHVIGNNIYDNAVNNIFAGADTEAVTIMYNTIDGVFANNATAVGIKLNSATGFNLLVAYNAIHDCKTPLSTASMNSVLSFYNQWDTDATAAANVNWVNGEGDEEDPANFPNFINEGAANYQPNATSAMNGAAGPTTMPAGLTTTNRAVGAAEPATVSGGGGGVSGILRGSR